MSHELGGLRTYKLFLSPRYTGIFSGLWSFPVELYNLNLEMI